MKSLKLYFSVLLFIILLPFLLNNEPVFFNKVINNVIPVITQRKVYVDLNKDLSYFKNKYSNSDIVGRIYIEGTNINEPLLQTNNNTYYLSHNILKRKDKRGSIFLDFRVNKSSRKKIIYGHNSSDLNVAFRDLENYYKENFYEKFNIINIETEEGLDKYQIFSVFVETDNWDYTRMFFSTDLEWYNHILKLKSKSFYDTGVNLIVNDKILILQTCSHHKDYEKYKKKYLLVVARLLN